MGQALKDVGRSFAGSGSPCTLDGKPASVLGRLLDFAVVAELPDGPSYEFSWATVGRVMLADGGFRS